MPIAVLQNGEIRPLEPLPAEWQDGQRLRVESVEDDDATPPASEDEIVRRIQACKSYGEWLEVTKLLPDDDGGYDIVKALDENRRQSGERPLLPDKSNQP